MLSDAALAILAKQAAVRSSDYVFPGSRGADHISASRLREVLQRLGRGDLTASASSRARSTSSRATGSWCSLTIPVPCPDPAERAVKMAMSMREEAGKLIAAWRRHGCELVGAGIAQDYATLGQIGFSENSGYTAIGTVCNLAARLCAEAKDGQILVSSRIAGAVEAVVKLEDLGNVELKGLRRPVAAFNVAQSTSASDARPNLTVVASGPEA